MEDTTDMAIRIDEVVSLVWVCGCPDTWSYACICR
jgi:hypothetical protein